MNDERIASDALTDAMISAVDQGVPDETVANEVIRLALHIIQYANGDRREAVPAVLRRLADHIEANPQAPVTLQ